jgi:hypothetical protein
MCCIVVLVQKFTHLFARLIVFKVSYGLTIDADFSFARESNCDVTASPLSQTFWNEVIEIYDD